MENISHAESAAGLPGWKASGFLLLLAVGIFIFFSLQALKFATSQAWKSVCRETFGETQQGAKAPTHTFGVLHLPVPHRAQCFAVPWDCWRLPCWPRAASVQGGFLADPGWML